MIYLYYIFFAIVIVNIGSEYEVGYITGILSIILFAAYIAHIFTLSIAVSKSAKKKGMVSDWIWVILTFIFGLPAAIIFALLTLGINSDNNSKWKSNASVFAIVSVFLLAAFLGGTFLMGMYSSYYTSTHFSTNFVYYENEDGTQVIYDKMGTAYTREELEQFKYYDRKGNVYSPIFHYDIFESEPDTHGFTCKKDGKDYENEYDFAVDRDGYFVIFPESDLHTFYSENGNCLYDDKGNIYFYPENCYWTPDGKLAFKKENLDKITYQYILDYKDKHPDEEY